MADTPPIPGLVQNAALLLTIAYLFDLSTAHWRADRIVLQKAFSGIIIGAVGITVMMTSWILGPGLIFDTRSVLLCISGLFFGFVPTVIAMAMTAALRIYQGGAGAVMGVSVIIATGAIGILWRNLRKNSLSDMSWRELYLFGIATHLVMLALTFTMPLETALRTLSKISLPVLLIYPVGTALLGMLMITRLRRGRMEDQLRESKEIFTRIFRQSPDIMTISRLIDGTYIDVNEEFTRQLGYTREEVIGRTAFDLGIWVDSADRDSMVEILQTKGEIKVEEYRFRRKDGSLIIGEMSARKTKIGGDQCLLGMFRNITEKTEAQKAQQESEEKFRSVVERSLVGIAIVDDVFRFIYVNEEFCRIAGYSEQELLGRDSRLSLSGESRQLITERFERRQQGDDIPAHYEFSFLQRDGALHIGEVRSATYSDSNGKSKTIIQVIDITDRKKNEDSLLLSQYAMDNAPESIILVRHDGSLEYVNSAACESMGYTREELMGMTIFEIDPDFPVEKWEQHKADLENFGRMTFNGRHRTKAGQLFPVEIVTNYFNYKGNFLGIAFDRDITERKRAEEALKKSEAYFRAITENASDILVISDMDGIITFASPSFESITGYHPEEMMGVSFFELIVPEDVPRVMEDFARALQTQNTYIPNSFRVRHKNGSELVLEGVGANLIHDPALKGFVMNARDITERRRMEDALREKERLLDLITENMSDMIRITDMQGRNLYVSPSHFKGLGYRMEERIGKSVFDLLHPDDLERIFNEFVKGAAGNERVTAEYRVKHANGHYIWLETVADILKDDQGKVAASIMSSRDVTERKQAEVLLQESQRRMSDIIEFLPDATLVIDGEGKVIAWNRAIEAMTGVKKEDMLGKDNYEYAIPFYGERRPILIDLALHPDPIEEKEYLTIRRMGDLVSGDVHLPALPSGNAYLSGTASVLRDSEGKIVGAIGILRDYTNRKNMEERLQRAEKMESLGILAGGVAHDLNNVLGVLVGYSELLLQDLPEGSRAEKHARNILRGGERAAAIIQDLLTMARRGVSVSETVNLNQIVTDCFKTPEFELMKTHHPDVLFRDQMEKDLFNIKGSPVHLSKSIMNLLSNAADAIKGEGTVTITTENRYVDVAIPGYENTQEGEYVVLTVTDTGSGISPEDMGRIFEPFYTKKVMGRSGTGLGLAVVWGTVKDHKGYIDVRTELNKGTSFVLYFPVTRDVLLKTDQALAESEYRGRGESILIVDDAEEQRSLAVTILEGLNYRAASAASGEEALGYLRTNKADLIILDMIMDPGIDGLETYRRILEIQPQQRAIIVSGFAKTDRVKMAQDLGAGEYVMKPYIIEKLGMAVRRELDKT